MQKITVAEVSCPPVKEGKKPFVKILATDGTEITGFDTKLKNLTRGSVIRVDTNVTTKEGKTYINIDKWELLEEGAHSPADAPPIEQGKSMEIIRIELASAEAQTAFNGIIQLAANKVISLDNNYLGKALDWANKKLSGKTTVEQDWDKLKRGEEPAKSTGLPRDPASIDTMGDLFTACLQDWPEEFKSREDVLKEFGVDHQLKIKDTPAECYGKLAAKRK